MTAGQARMHSRMLSNGSERERCTERLNGFRKTLLVHSKVFITSRGEQETLLNRQLQRKLSSLDEVFVGTKSCFDSLAVVFVSTKVFSPA